MATGIETKLFEAIAAHLQSLVLSPALPVAYPNAVFTQPANNAPYLQLLEFSAPTTPLSVDPGGTNEYVGFFQINVFWPQGEGLSSPKEVAAAIIAHFKRNTILTREGVRVEITQAHDSGHLKDEPRVMLPVTIRYRAHVPNPA